MKNPQIILETKTLDIGYRTKKGDFITSKNINIQLKTTHLIALVGKNGVGKSTLLRTLTHLQPALHGQVLLHNKPINQYTALQLATQISLVLTDSLPESNLTVYELIALGRQPYTNWLDKQNATDIQKINEAIEMLQLHDLIHKKHTEISDGQLQKVLLARTLAQDTPLIILDEPTTHLDISHNVSLLKSLKKLAHENNKCILYSTHDIDLAIQLADEIIVITEEQVVQNQPCNLIPTGIFNTLFNNPNITFDAQKGKFVVQ